MPGGPGLHPVEYNKQQRKEVNMKGTIKTKTDRGFGFISRDGVTKDLFFHSKDLVGVTFEELQVGAVVTFDVVDGEKGPSAKNVKLAA
jgi:CspA family cold shock protein